MIQLKYKIKDIYDFEMFLNIYNCNNNTNYNIKEIVSNDIYKLIKDKYKNYQKNINKYLISYILFSFNMNDLRGIQYYMSIFQNLQKSKNIKFNKIPEQYIINIMNFFSKDELTIDQINLIKQFDSTLRDKIRKVKQKFDLFYLDGFFKNNFFNYCNKIKEDPKIEKNNKILEYINQSIDETIEILDNNINYFSININNKIVLKKKNSEYYLKEDFIQFMYDIKSYKYNIKDKIYSSYDVKNIISNLYYSLEKLIYDLNWHLLPAREKTYKVKTFLESTDFTISLIINIFANNDFKENYYKNELKLDKYLKENIKYRTLWYDILLPLLPKKYESESLIKLENKIVIINNDGIEEEYNKDEYLPINFLKKLFTAKEIHFNNKQIFDINDVKYKYFYKNDNLQIKKYFLLLKTNIFDNLFLNITSKSIHGSNFFKRYERDDYFYLHKKILNDIILNNQLNLLEYNISEKKKIKLKSKIEEYKLQIELIDNKKINNTEIKKINKYNYLDLNIETNKCKEIVDKVLKEKKYGENSEIFFNNKKYFERLFPINYYYDNSYFINNPFYNLLHEINIDFIYELFIKKLKFKIIQKNILNKKIDIIESVNSWKEHQNIDNNLNSNKNLLEYLKYIVSFINMKINYLNKDIESIYQIYDEYLKPNIDDDYGLKYANYSNLQNKIYQNDLDKQIKIINNHNQKILDSYFNQKIEQYILTNYYTKNRELNERFYTNDNMKGGYNMNLLDNNLGNIIKHNDLNILNFIKHINKKKVIKLILLKNKFEKNLITKSNTT